MIDTAAPPADPPRRRRGAELQQAIFDAVFDQINDVGYARLTMDRIAAAAGTSKPVLYRRWADKDVLVLDALRESLPTVTEPPPGQSLRADLLHVLGGMRDAFVVTRGITFHVLAAEAGGDCRNLANERLFGPAHQLLLSLLGRAADRGEIRPELVTDLIADIGPALLRNRAIDGPVPDHAVVVAIVDEALIPLLTGVGGAPGADAG